MVTVVVAVEIVMMIVAVMAVAVVVAATRLGPGARTILIMPVFVRFLVRLVADDVAQTSADARANRCALAAMPGLVADDRAKNRPCAGSERSAGLGVVATGQECGARQ